MQEAEKKKLEKKIKNADNLVKKALYKEAKKIQAVAKTTIKISRKLIWPIINHACPECLDQLWVN